jgi:putative thioredoxin
MTSASFNRPGAIDLSMLKTKAQAPAGAPRSGGGVSYLVDVTEANFEQVMQGSMQHLIVAEFTSPRVANGEVLSATLEELATEAAGKFLLARINVDTSPQIVQALGIQAVPMVVGVVGGQLAPLFQGVQPKEQIKAFLDQLFQAAVANGIVGTAQPVGGAPGDDEPDEPAEDAEPERDPRFAAADDALDVGDYAAARDEFDRLVDANPKDAEAVAGRASAGLLARTADADPAAVLAAAQAAPTDVAAQLAAADTEMMNGTPDLAFTRLVGLVRATTADERTAVRLRLLELFETLDPADPHVLKGRRDLMSALF